MLLTTGYANPQIAARRRQRDHRPLFDSPRWRFIACQPGLDATKRERMYVDLYFERCSRAVPLEVRVPRPAEVRVEGQVLLVQASDNFDAFMLMNDEIVKLDDLLFASRRGPGHARRIRSGESDAR